MLIEVVATYLLADITPDRGYVLFAPDVVRADSTPTKHIVTWAPVRAVLDGNGSIKVELTDSYDLGWMINNGNLPVPYKVEEHLSGGVRCYHVMIKGPSPFDLADAQPPDESGVVYDDEVTVAAVEPVGRFEIWADTSVVEQITP